jgi:hypothetical protein
MREDNRKRRAEKFSEKLLDAALSNHHGAEPEDDLEDRVLSNLRRQPRAARSGLWNPAPAIIAGAIVLALFAVDHLGRRPAVPHVALSGADARRGGDNSTLTSWQAQAGERKLTADGVRPVKAFTAPPSSTRRRDLALNLNARRADEPAETGLRLEEVRITEIRLDEIVIGNNERQE